MIAMFGTGPVLAGASDVEETELENSEQTNRACADNDDVCFDGLS